MNDLKKHIEPKILHFKRWSNKSYAIFNSIGVVVNIGFLSALVQKLATVKSVVADGLVYFSENLFDWCESKEESLADLNEKDIFSNNILIVNNIQVSDSSYSFESIVFFQNKFKAFLRPFLMYSYSSLGIRKIIHQIN